MVRITRSRIIGAVSVFSLLAATSTAADTIVRGMVTWARPNTPAAQARTDFEDCRTQSEKIDANNPFAVVVVYDTAHGGHGGAHAGAHGAGAHGGGVRAGGQGGHGAARGGGGSGAAAGAAGSLIGAAIGNAIAAQMWTSKLRTVFFSRCMHQRGYAAVTLTGREHAEANTAGEKGEDAWLDTLYARPDFVARLTAASRPVAPLPDVDDLTLASNAVRYDPASFRATSGVVTKDIVLIGHASWLGAARLSEDVKSHTAPDFHAGDLFHAVTSATPDGGDALYWCAARPRSIRCVRQVGDYYASINAFGLTHMIPWFGGDPALMESADFNDVDIKLVPEAATPLDVTFRVVRVKDDGVTLLEVVGDAHDGDEVWAAELPFDPDGHAVLPFFDHRLVLTRTGKDGVTAAWQADGDGSPPPACNASAPGLTVC